MVDYIDRLPPSEPYVRLLRKGRKVWNRWVLTALDDSDANWIKLEELTGLSQEEAASLASELNLDRLPSNGQAPYFAGVDFTKAENRSCEFDGCSFMMKGRDEHTYPGPNFDRAKFRAWTSFSGSRFGDSTIFAHADFGPYCDFKKASFSQANFVRARFADQATFKEAKLGSVVFDGVEFGGSSDFTQASFEWGASFNGCSFGGDTIFFRAEFAGSTSFDGVTFKRESTFDSCTFGTWTHFENTKFGASSFISAEFGQNVRFEKADFRGDADFTGASFQSGTSFKGTKFWGVRFHGLSGEGLRRHAAAAVKRPHLYGQEAKEVVAQIEAMETTTLPDVSFAGSLFRGDVHFFNLTFLGPVNFRNSTFWRVPVFHNCQGLDQIDPTGMDVSFGRYIGPPLSTWTTDSEISASIRRLRKMMHEIHADEMERRLLILERAAERGVLWSLGGLRNRLRAAGLTALMFFYWISSNYGVSLLRPVLGLAMSTVLFHQFYASSYSERVGEIEATHPDLVSFTLGNIFPFASGLNPARRDVLLRLFEQFPGQIQIPLPIELMAASQSILGAIFIFLLLLAIRNRFKLA